MYTLILVRYGQWEGGHLNETGKETMTASAAKLREYATQDFVLVSATVPRAIESAQVVARQLGYAKPIAACLELYAAEEDGRLPDVASAWKALEQVGESHAVVIAVVSREYIETLPSYVLQRLGVEPPTGPTSLDRGEILVIDFAAKSLTKR